MRLKGRVLKIEIGLQIMQHAVSDFEVIGYLQQGLRIDLQVLLLVGKVHHAFIIVH
jgi:hypothetical protein